MHNIRSTRMRSASKILRSVRGLAAIALAGAMITVITLSSGCPRGPTDLPGVVGTSLIRLTPVATGLTSPVDFAADDAGGRIFIVDQVGLVRVLGSDGVLLSDPFLDLRNRMIGLSSVYDERGLLGLALHPAFA